MSAWLFEPAREDVREPIVFVHRGTDVLHLLFNKYKLMLLLLGARFVFSLACEGAELLVCLPPNPAEFLTLFIRVR